MAGRSGKAWADMKKNPAELGVLRARAVMYVILHPESTARELSQFAGDTESATIRRRLSEVERAGFIRRTGARVCTVTGQQATTYVACVNSKVAQFIEAYAPDLVKKDGRTRVEDAIDIAAGNMSLTEGPTIPLSQLEAESESPDYNCQSGA